MHLVGTFFIWQMKLIWIIAYDQAIIDHSKDYSKKHANIRGYGYLI